MGAPEQDNSRALAATALLDIVDGPGHHDLSYWLERCNEEQRPRFAAVLYAACRWYPRFDWYLGVLLKKPIRRKDRSIHMLLVSAMAQLEILHHPPHAVLNETVHTATRLGKSWAKGLVNGTLRAFSRQHAALQQQSQEYTPAHYAHPEWLSALLLKDWPAHAETIMHAANQHPPMVLRVNRMKLGRPAYLEKLQEAGIQADAQIAVDAVQLEEPQDISALPGFRQGLVSVQDTSAQLAATLLEVSAGQKVLDACSAPGGKTCHLLEICPDIQLFSADRSKRRLQAVSENLQRLDLTATLLDADMSRPHPQLTPASFDRILLDAPCSATGVIRRHPEIKLLRNPVDIQSVVELQRKILDNCWTLLRPGGRILYATCSILKQENEHQMEEFVSVYNNARECIINATWGIKQTIGRQILPGPENLDGFYYALLEKTDAAESKPQH